MKRLFVLVIVVLVVVWLVGGVWVITQPRIAVIPHHDVVANERKVFLQKISRRRILTDRIILLSTDHFGANQHRILTSSNTLVSKLRFPSDAFFSRLSAVDNAAIFADHGITNVVPELKAYFPNADIYPVIIGNEVRETELHQLLTPLQKVCDASCLIIASVDFSHYLPAAIAMTHDAYTIQGLKNRDEQRMMQAETDSPQTLWLMVQLAKKWQLGLWKTAAQTNSALLLDDYWSESTSHVFGWYQIGYSLSVPLIKTFTLAHVSSPNQLDSLGNRLTYGVDELAINNNTTVCGLLLPDESLLTGWQTDEKIVAGVLLLSKTSTKYIWKREVAIIPSNTCLRGKLHLLPGSIDKVH